MICRLGMGVCLTQKHICDDIADCLYAEDERNCPSRPAPTVAATTTTTTTTAMPCTDFKCKTSGKCIKSSSTCDGRNDCGNGDNSDESLETCPKGICHYENDFLCKNGNCIKDKNSNPKICNYYDDCGDCSEEQPDFCRSITCPSDRFRCRTGLCIPQTRVNNFWNNDCGDWSDEPFWWGWLYSGSCRYCNKDIKFC